MTGMIEVTTYDTATGRITGRLKCSKRNADANAPYVLGFYDPREYVIVDGKPLRKSDEEIAQREIALAEQTLRRKRDNELIASDWTQLPDAPLTTAEKQLWAVYRQQLRDLPEQTQDPLDVNWPAKPS